MQGGGERYGTSHSWRGYDLAPIASTGVLPDPLSANSEARSRRAGSEPNLYYQARRDGKPSDANWRGLGTPRRLASGKTVAGGRSTLLRPRWGPHPHPGAAASPCRAVAPGRNGWQGFITLIFRPTCLQEGTYRVEAVVWVP